MSAKTHLVLRSGGLSECGLMKPASKTNDHDLASCRRCLASTALTQEQRWHRWDVRAERLRLKREAEKVVLARHRDEFEIEFAFRLLGTIGATGGAPMVLTGGAG